MKTPPALRSGAFSLTLTMPKFFELFGWRFFAVMFDLLNEPFHVHVTDKGKKECKYWVLSNRSLELAFNRGFSPAELRKIEGALRERLEEILRQYETICHATNIRPQYKRARSA